MHKLVFALVAVVGFVPSAYAGASSNSPSFDWTGFYLGGHIGYASGNEDWTLIDNPGGGEDAPFGSVVASDSLSGLLGGLHLGYNWTAGTYVYGFEGDVSLTDVSGAASKISTGEKPGPRSWSSDMNFLATFGPRLGTVHNKRTLVYGEAGLAVARERFFHLGAYGGQPQTPPPNPSPPGRTYGNTVAHFGWFVGLGVEHAFSDHWSGRIEYNFVDLFGNEGLWGKPPNAAIFGIDQKFNVIKAGLTYHFG